MAFLFSLSTSPTGCNRVVDVVVMELWHHGVLLFAYLVNFPLPTLFLTTWEGFSTQVLRTFI